MMFLYILVKEECMDISAILMYMSGYATKAKAYHNADYLKTKIMHLLLPM